MAGREHDSEQTQDVWTLKLNPKATWNDGKPVTADDVIFSIDMYKKTKEFGDSATVNEWVKSTKKIDDKTVEFTLNKANPRFQLDYWDRAPHACAVRVRRARAVAGRAPPLPRPPRAPRGPSCPFRAASQRAPATGR